MFQAFRPSTRAVAAAALLSSFAIGLPAVAQTTPPASAPAAAASTPAPAATAPAAPAATTAAAPSSSPKAQQHAEKHSARVEQHITDLKKALKITKDQESTWDTFAQVMRDNGDAMEQAIQEREDTKSLDAIHDLQSYAKVAQIHADGAQKLAAAFQPVYDALTPDQKKNADTLFEHTRHGGPHAAAKKK